MDEEIYARKLADRGFLHHYRAMRRAGLKPAQAKESAKGLIQALRDYGKWK